MTFSSYAFDRFVEFMSVLDILSIIDPEFLVREWNIIPSHKGISWGVDIGGYGRIVDPDTFEVTNK